METRLCAYKIKEKVNTKGPNGQKKPKEVTRPKGTSLWMRKPLIELHELHEHARRMKSRKWGAKFYNAAQMVTGVAASPLEVAGILLLSLPRSRGGARFETFMLTTLRRLPHRRRALQGKKSATGIS